ncbi:MAG: efflux RND transporter periplasmic adaptor subunit [Saccharospirillaceae bacterium]|nr:hypothetical protein A3759_15685 [Thalassolituus sp. HI0120]MCH2040054.1 efflux RND transporter periplasmic adaptor subunit [Saccharospirillaceae bacterium]
MSPVRDPVRHQGDQASNKGSMATGALIGFGVLALGIAISIWVVKSAPKPQKVAPETKARLVEVESLTRQSSRPTWLAGGQVTASQQVMLKPQVNGRIVAIDDAAVPGARLQQGDLLARIDPQDFRLMLEQKQAAYTQALADLDIEKGQASLAREEFELSETELSPQDKALVLREPQIARAKAAVRTARANLNQARLDLERSEIRMPFAGQINRRNVSVGSQVSASSEVFDVISTDEFWIEVKIPSAFLPWLDKQHLAEISMPGWLGKSRQARILNVLPAVDSADRQVKLMLAIRDPLALQGSELPPVLLNDFVEVRLFGRALENTYQIERRYLNNKDEVWVVSADNELQKRALNVLYHGREMSWVAIEREGEAADKRGFDVADRLLISRIDAPVPGYPVRIAGRRDEPVAPDAQNAGAEEALASQSDSEPQR